MSCMTPHLYSSVAMYQYQQQQQLAQHPHLLARPLLLCHRGLPSVGSSRSGGDPFRRLAEAQPPRNPAKPLTPFFIADILRRGDTGRGRSASPPPPPARQVRDSTSRGRRHVSHRPWNDVDEPPRPAAAAARRHHSTDADDDDDDLELDDCCDDVIDDDEEIDVDDERDTSTTTSSQRHHSISTSTNQLSTSVVCPLDALLRMTSQPFDDSSSLGTSDVRATLKSTRITGATDIYTLYLMRKVCAYLAHQ